MSILVVSDSSAFSCCLPALSFRKKGKAGGYRRPVDSSKEQSFRTGQYWLICKSCRSHITNIEQKIRVEGSHKHTFFNPSGQVFGLGCFKHAPGCTRVGTPCSEFSWFAGMTWQVAVCSNCFTQLGWYFAEEPRYFYGLILTRLIAAAE